MNELNGKLTNYYIPGTDAELYWTKSDDEENNKSNDGIDEQANELDHFKIIGLLIEQSKTINIWIFSMNLESQN